MRGDRAALAGSAARCGELSRSYLSMENAWEAAIGALATLWGRICLAGDRVCPALLATVGNGAQRIHFHTVTLPHPTLMLIEHPAPTHTHHTRADGLALRPRTAAALSVPPIRPCACHIASRALRSGSGQPQ